MIRNNPDITVPINPNMPHFDEPEMIVVVNEQNYEGTSYETPNIAEAYQESGRFYVDLSEVDITPDGTAGLVLGSLVVAGCALLAFSSKSPQK